MSKYIVTRANALVFGALVVLLLLIGGAAWERQRECPENGGMTPREIRLVGTIAGWGNADAMGVAVDGDRR
jgi:hypothetical protein